MHLKKNDRFAHAALGLTAAVLLAALTACSPKTGGDVMATVDGRKIFRTDLDKYYDNQISSAQQTPTGEQATALRLQILHQLIEDEILMAGPLPARLASLSDLGDRSSLFRASSFPAAIHGLLHSRTFDSGSCRTGQHSSDMAKRRFRDAVVTPLCALRSFCVWP